MGVAGSTSEPTPISWVKTLEMTHRNVLDVNILENGVDHAWVQVQKDTFTKWINHKLKGTDYSVHEITEDFRDGVLLINLLHVLAPGKKMPGR